MVESSGTRREKGKQAILSEIQQGKRARDKGRLKYILHHNSSGTTQTVESCRDLRDGGDTL